MTVQPLFPGLDLPQAASASPDTCLQTRVLCGFPDIPADAKCFHAKRLGTAGELFVDSLLVRLGFDPIPTHEYQPYDRIVPVNGHLAKMQVKVRLSAESGRFIYQVCHGNPRHDTGVRAYGVGDFDLLALVCLHHNVIKFSASRARQQYIALSEVARLQARPFETLGRAIIEAGFGPDTIKRDGPDWPAAA